MLVPAPYASTPNPRGLEHALAHLERAGTLLEDDVARLIAAFARARRPEGAGRARTPYVRDVLYDGARGEAMLATWRGEWACAPHDHGAARGAVLVVRGRFRERRYRFDGHELERENTRWAQAGDVVYVEAGAIHDMESADDAGVTLHLYAPVPGPTRLYDAARRETIIASPGAGAWLPAVAAHAIVPWHRA